MTVVTAEIENGAALIDQSLERDAFKRQIEIECRRRLAGVVLRADRSIGDRLEVFGD
jgi:hypothetical protein